MNVTFYPTRPAPPATDPDLQALEALGPICEPFGEAISISPVQAGESRVSKFLCDVQFEKWHRCEFTGPNDAKIPFSEWESLVKTHGLFAEHTDKWKRDGATAVWMEISLKRSSTKR